MKLLGCDPNYCLRTALCCLTPIDVGPDMRAPHPPLVDVDLREWLQADMLQRGIFFHYEPTEEGDVPTQPPTGGTGAGEGDQQS